MMWVSFFNAIGLPSPVAFLFEGLKTAYTPFKANIMSLY